MNIRNSTKAIIVRDGNVLFTKCQFRPDDEAITYLLPGGGQNKGETLEEALRREVREETGATVTVGEMVLVREYIAPHSQWGDLHQVEFFFLCQLETEPDPAAATELDSLQVGIEWLPIDSLGDYAIFPEKLKTCIQGDGTVRSEVYIGNC